MSFETIVVDNGSTDGSAAAAEIEFGATVIRNPENRGFCAANNQGIAVARGEFVALLNNDAEAAPGWLAALSRLLDAPPKPAWPPPRSSFGRTRARIDKAGHLIYPDGQNRGRGTGSIDRGQFDSPRRRPLARWLRRPLSQVDARPDRRLRRRLLRLWRRRRTRPSRAHRRLDLRSTRLTPSPATTAVPPSEKVRRRRLSLIERNRILLAAKLFPWSLLWLNPVYFCMRAVAGASLATQGAGDTAYFPGLRGKFAMALGILRGWLTALPLIPRMLRKRARIAEIRRLRPSEVRRLILNNRLRLREVA